MNKSKIVMRQITIPEKIYQELNIKNEDEASVIFKFDQDNKLYLEIENVVKNIECPVCKDISIKEIKCLACQDSKSISKDIVYSAFEYVGIIMLESKSYGVDISICTNESGRSIVNVNDLHSKYDGDYIHRLQRFLQAILTKYEICYKDESENFNSILTDSIVDSWNNWTSYDEELGKLI